MDGRPRRVIGAVIGALVILLLGILLIQIILYPSDFWRNDGYYFPLWILGFIFVLILIGFIFRVLFWTLLGSYRSGDDLYRYRHWHGRYRDYRENSAERILDERYARGEITREQYQQMVEDIRRDKQGGNP